MSETQLKNNVLTEIPDTEMGEREQLISDITGLLSNVPNIEMLRLIRWFVIRFMEKEGLKPESILKDEQE